MAHRLASLLTIVIAALALLSSSPAQAERRVALVIGNDAYTEVQPLQKAVPDAQAMAAELNRIGFETVLATDVGRRDFNIAIADFTQRLSPGDTAVVFYAGHGVEIEGENYLLPTDIVAPSEVQPGLVTSESIALSSLLDRVRRTGVRATLAIVDACRDNPFAQKTGRSIGGARGLARIAAPEGTFVVYSAGAGQQALDRLDDTDANPNSVFTRNLLPKLTEPGLELRELVADLRVEVRDLARTRDHAQFPAYYDELLGEFYFTPARGFAAEPATAAPPAAGSDDDAIRRDFELARQIGSAGALRAFLDRYADRDGEFTVLLARQMLGELKGTESAAPEPEPERETAMLAPAPAVPDAARDRMRGIQTELNRLGCNAGGADGIAGRRTRSAFADFIGATGAALRDSDLGSEKALAVLKAAKAPACRKAEPRSASPDPVDAAPEITLAGSWSFKASCPLFVKTSGTVTYRSTGGSSFASTWNDSLGQGGGGTTTQSGRTFSTNSRLGAISVAETGTIAADGKSYTASNSLGCKVTARKY